MTTSPARGLNRKKLFVNGENIASSGVIGSPVLNTSATAASPAGTYPISIAAGSLFASNYTFVYSNGTMTVNKALLTITADNKIKTYNRVAQNFCGFYEQLFVVRMANFKIFAA